MTTKGVPSAGYVRRSTDKQEESLERQRDEIVKYARAHGYAVVAWYTDDAVSGDETVQRRGFLKMQADAKSAAWKTVVCWNQDRFGRFDIIDAGFYIKPFRDAGVQLVTCDAGPVGWEKLTDQIVFAVNQSAKRSYLLDLSKNTASGMLRAALRGDWMGEAPYGFYVNRETRRLVPIQEEIAIVRWIFERYARHGWRARRIALALNKRGVPTAYATRRGLKSRWNTSMVHRVLTHDAYIGFTSWNKVSQAAYNRIVAGTVQPTRGKGGKRRNKPGDWVTTEDTHPAVIDRDTFDLVQVLLAERRTDTSPHQNATFLLTGVLRCGVCGAPMFGSVRWPRKHYRCPGCGRKRIHRLRPGITEHRCPCGVVFEVKEGDGSSGTPHYVCSRGVRDGGCRVRSVDEVAALDVLGAEVAKLVGDPERWRGEVVRVLREAAAADPARLETARASLAGLETKVRKWTERFLDAPAHYTSDIAKALDAARAERDRVAEEVKTLESSKKSAANVDAVAENVVAAMHMIREVIVERAALGDRDAVRAVLRRIFESVTVDFDPDAAGASAVRGYRLKTRPTAFMIRNLLPGLVDVTAEAFEGEAARIFAECEEAAGGRASGSSKGGAPP
jgi:DNA invertase Pin-like site-specific DNA recombinase